MTPTPEVQERLRRYLLGQLADDAREEFEKELMASDELYQELLMVEDEIVDEYVGGRHSENERAAFEKHFLATPERHDKLKFGRAFNRYVSDASKRGKTSATFLPGFFAKQSFLVRATPVVVAIVVIAGTLWFFRNQRSTPRTFANLNLMISQDTRSEGTQPPTLKLPLREDALKIVLALPDRPAATRYRIELGAVSGEKRPLEVTGQDGHSLTVVILAKDLRPGLYSIRLFAVGNGGVEEHINGSYFFNLE